MGNMAAAPGLRYTSATTQVTRATEIHAVNSLCE